jgi:TolB-like protein/DNA-binding winged helix-turn-helix (wHTH) protein/cytochrome c-type biogenesis protein CcmH/NrfG
VASLRYRSGPFIIDPNTAEISREGIPLKLRPQAFQVLQALIERQGQLVSREELIQQIWGSDTFVDFDQGLNFCIREVRKALGDGADEPKYLQTLPRRGYRFIGPVEQVREEPRDRSAVPHTEAPALASAPAKAPEVVVATAPISTRTPGWVWGALTVLFCTLVALGAWWYQGRPTRMHQPVRLVVLPFENLTGDPKQDYLVRGVVEEITAQLGSMEPVALAVVGRTSAEAVASHGWRIDEIAKQLQVDYVVEGSVRREGDQLRITAQLIRSNDMAHVWAESYDRDAMKLFTVEEQVAANIAREVNLALGRNTASSGQTTGSSNAGAMDAYLRGRDHMNSFLSTIAGGHFDPAYADAYVNAEREFKRAIELDPRFALPYAGLANLATTKIRQDFDPDPDWKLAGQYATEALQLDPASADARLVLARTAFLGDGRPREAERYLTEILNRNPNDVRAIGMLMQCHFVMGKLTLAVSEAEKAARLDPMNSGAEIWLADAYYHNREYKRALEIFKDVYPKRPESFAVQMYLLHAYYMDGNTAGWLGIYLDRLDLEARLGPSKDAADRASRARAIYKQEGSSALLKYLKGEGHDFFIQDGDRSPAYRHVMLGENKEAVDALDKAIGQEQRVRALRQVVNDPMLDVLRGDPRFPELMKRLIPDN